ncbi:MAG: helix-turn-helix transcriptional regulator [Chloroflexi bacterium]|nr:helix-turn-helix transcriptional regulator [Chloroflexota bacterium]
MDQNLPGDPRLAFGRRVRRLRRLRGLSQEALALRCGLDRTYVGGVERGERNISLLNIHRIARGLGLPVRDLFADKGE